jgi:membrane-associated phospholipid phosphatase
MESLHDRDGRALGRLTALAVVAWLAYVGMLMVLLGGEISPDLLLVVAGLVAIALLANQPVLRELLPFPLIALAWEAMRGLSDSLVTRVHAADVVNVERALFGPFSGGRTPSEALQSAFHIIGSVNLLDAAMTVVYLGHFAAPVIFGYLLWRRDRSIYYRYAMAMIIVALAGYGTQLLFPVAPPRLAAGFGATLAVQDITARVLDGFGAFPIASWGYGHLSGNELAALPSLHAAFPLVGAFFLAQVSRREAWLALAWSALVWFSIVYLGQHFVVDAILGAAYAAACCALVGHPSFDRAIERLAAIRVRAPVLSQG